MFSSNIALVALGPVHDEMVCLVINPNINHNLSAMAVDTTFETCAYSCWTTGI